MTIRRLVSAWREPGWERTLWIMFLAQMVSAIGFSNIFPFLPLYVESLGSSQGFSVEFLAGMVFSAQALTMMVASPIWGALADRYGRKLMVQRATFGGAVLLLLMGFVTTAEQLVLLRALQGLVTGTVAAANALVAAAAPRSRTGYAMGVIQVALWGGVAIGPLIGGFMADQWGYQSAFVLTAILLALSGLLVHYGVQEQFTPVLMSGGGRPLAFWVDWRHVLAMPGVPMTYAMRFLSHLGRMMIFPIAPLFIQLLLPTTDRVNSYAGLMIGLASAASTASALYLGRLGDRVGHKPVLVLSALVLSLLYVPQTFVTTAEQLLFLQLLAGFAAGGVIPSVSALLAGYTEPGEEGTVYGLDNSIGAAARALAPLVGASFALWFGLRSTFLATAAIFLLMFALAWWRLPDVKREK